VRLEIPQPQRVITACAKRQTPIGADGNIVYPVRMPAHPCYLSSSRDVPQTQRLIPRPAERDLPIWAKRTRFYGVGVAQKPYHLLSSRNIPQK
jgi:hypothetical protein